MTKKTKTWLVLGVVASLLVLLIALVSVVANSPAAQGITSTDTSQVATPTDTPPPDTTQVTPVATPTVQQRIGGMLNSDIGVTTYTFNTDSGPTTTKVLYDTKSQTVTVTADVAYHNDTDSLKMVTYNIFKDIYTRGISAIKSVDLRVFGLVQDQYGKKSSVVIATATLNADTASKFVWDNIDNNQAWSDYDATWLLPLGN